MGLSVVGLDWDWALEVELEHKLHLVDFVVVGLEDLKEDIDWAVDHKGVVGQVVVD